MEATISKTKLMLMETRPQFLLLTPAAFSVGIAAAVFRGYFNSFHMILALIGSLLFHIAVNVINDYYDYVRGTDMLVQRTPFSGGSGLLPQGLLKPNEVLALGVGSLIIGVTIGSYFIYIYPILAPIVLASAFLAYGYTPFLTRVYITEVFPGLGFGPLLIIGAYITQLNPAHVSVPLEVFLVSLPLWFLVSGLLWINEIPDFDADKQTGRKHGVLALGKKYSAYAYVAILIGTYLSIVIPVALKLVSPFALAGLLTIPVAIKAGQGAVKFYNDTEKLVPVLGQNVLVVLVTPVLMTIGLVIGHFV